MKKRDLKAVVFDLDGVIVNTPQYHYQAWRKLASELGFDFTEGLNEEVKGVTRIDSLNLILKWAKLEKSYAEKIQLCDQKNLYYLEYIKDIDRSDTLAGVVGLLDELKHAGVKIGLGSASKNAVRILDCLELRSYFMTIVDGTTVKNGKPHPETFEKACTNLSVDPKNTIVFEDASKGVEAANAGGMVSVGLGDSDILGHADLVLDSLEGARLNDLLKKLKCFNEIT